MSGTYQRCPFCEKVFDLGPTGHTPMRRHMLVFHPEREESEDG